MSTEFRYETVFDASSKTCVLAAYFDPDHLATQDEAAELCGRTLVAAHEDAAVRSCTWRVHSLRSLPVFVRPFAQGGRLSYLESMTWRKADDEIDLTIVPQVLGGRVQITALYQLADVAPGKVRRIYQGTIGAQLSLVSGKVERAIAAEFAKSMPVMTACTQRWLLRAGI